MAIRVTEHKNFKELLDEMDKELHNNLEGLRKALELLEEKMEGTGEGSAAYPNMKVLVDPDSELVKNQLVPVLPEMVNKIRALRSSIAIFKSLFSEGELSVELNIKAVWDGAHVRLVIVRTT